MPQSYIRPELLYAWHGQSLLIANTRGDCGEDQKLSGFYFREARHLRALCLTIDGELPWRSEAAVIEPLARLNLNPFSAYYADYASPLMFVVSLAHLYSWTGEKACLERHWDTARRILDWAREHGDMDGDGYLEYQMCVL